MSRTEDLKHILDTIRLALRLLDVTNREVESRKGWSHGYLSRILSGNIELRMEHVLDIAGILGMAPAEFFDLAWPHKPQPPTPPAARLQSLLRRYQPIPPAAAVRRDEVVQLLREALAELGREAPSTAGEPDAERDAPTPPDRSW
jgi:transcriptional regulator with XRE-family HTH domain